MDLRVELTDHIASEIEAKMNNEDSRGFYQLFKSYMFENKSALLKNLRQFRQQADKKMLRQVVSNLIHWKTLLSSLSIFFIFFTLKKLVDFPIDLWFPISLVLIPIFIFLKFIFEKEAKFSRLHRLLFWLPLADYFIFSNLWQLSWTEIWAPVVAFLIIWVNVSATITMVELKAYYQREFEKL